MDYKDITPYEYKKIGFTTYIINYRGDLLITIEYTNEEHVKKQVGMLNGAFREGILFGKLNEVEL